MVTDVAIFRSLTWPVRDAHYVILVVQEDTYRMYLLLFPWLELDKDSFLHLMHITSVISHLKVCGSSVDRAVCIRSHSHVVESKMRQPKYMN